MTDTQELQSIINSAIASGQKHIFLPPRVWNLDRGDSSNGGPCVTVPATASDLQIHGAGREATIFRMADGSPGSTRQFYIQGPGTVISNCTLDGGVQTDVDEHRAGILVMSPGFRAYDVEARNHTGDGFYLYSGANDSLLDNCLATSNNRNGITFGSNMDDVNILNSQFLSNGAQQVDTEPGAGAVVSGLLLHRCKLDAQGITKNYVLTLGGSGIGASEGHDVSIVECELNGGVYVVWGKKITLTDCYGINNTAHHSLEVWRTTHDLRVTRCNFTVQSSAFGLLVTGTSEASMPANVGIENTQVHCEATGAYGIYLNAVTTARIANCALIGNGVATSNRAAGIGIRATTFKELTKCVEINDNRIESFGDCGLTIDGNAVLDPVTGAPLFSHIKEAWIRGNSIGNGTRDDGNPITSLRRGMILDDGTNIVSNLYLGPNNTFDPSVTTQMVGVPMGCVTLPSSP